MNVEILSKKVFFHAVLLLGVVISIFPFYWLVVMATNETSAMFAFPPKLTFGSYFVENFNNVMQNMNFFRALLNTVFVAVVSTTLQLFFNSLTASRLPSSNFRARRFSSLF